jgi:hypothetical protein
VQARIEEVTQTPVSSNGQSVYTIISIANKALSQVSRLLYLFSARARYNCFNTFPARPVWLLAWESSTIENEIVMTMNWSKYLEDP